MVVVLCVIHSFTHSFILSSGTAFTSTPQLRHERDRHMKIFRYDLWILLNAGVLELWQAHCDGRSAYRHLAWSRPTVY